MVRTCYWEAQGDKTVLTAAGHLLGGHPTTAQPGNPFDDRSTELAGSRPDPNPPNQSGMLLVCPLRQHSNFYSTWQSRLQELSFYPPLEPPVKKKVSKP